MRTRQRLASVALALVAVLASSCDRSAPPAPPVDAWQPTVGTCHDGFTYSLSQAAYEQLQCEEPHLYETVHTGTFGKAMADPPAVESQQFKDTWASCDGPFDQYLGGDWRDRKLVLRVAVPKPAAWKQGARWYACEALVMQLHGAQTRLTSSMRDSFATLPELLYGCADLTAANGQTFARRCDEPHNAEYVGHFLVDLDYEKVQQAIYQEGTDVRQACDDAVGKFTKTSGVYGQWLWSARPDAWQLGDHHVRCFLWTDHVIVSKSLKAL